MSLSFSPLAFSSSAIRQFIFIPFKTINAILCLSPDRDGLFGISFSIFELGNLFSEITEAYFKVVSSIPIKDISIQLASSLALPLAFCGTAIGFMCFTGGSFASGSNH